MKSKKPLISVIVLLAIISSTMGFAFAPFSGYLSIEFDKTTANVGDTVTLTVTPSNEGLDSWNPLEIYVPIPWGTQYVSHVVPDRTLQNYDPGSGIWNVNRMRHDERGHLKNLIITLKVLPEAAGKTVTGTTSFQTLKIEETGEDLVASGQVPPVRSATIFIEPEPEPEPEPESEPVTDPEGPGIGPGNGTGNGTGSGALNGSIGAGSLQSGGGGGNGKAYEVFQDTPKSEIYYGLAIILIAVVIILGYLYGTKRKQ